MLAWEKHTASRGCTMSASATSSPTSARRSEAMDVLQLLIKNATANLKLNDQIAIIVFARGGDAAQGDTKAAPPQARSRDGARGVEPRSAASSRPTLMY